MRYEFSKREKILLIIVILALIAYGWYRVIYKPINDEISSLNSQMATEQTDTAVNLQKIQEMNSMEEEVEQLKASGDVDTTPMYDNSQSLLVSLNRILLSARSYYLNFGDLSTRDYVVTRPISVSFSANSYSEARMIIDRLSEEAYCNQISNVVISTNTGLSSDVTDVSLVINFYEILE